MSQRSTAGSRWAEDLLLVFDEPIPIWNSLWDEIQPLVLDEQKIGFWSSMIQRPASGSWWANALLLLPSMSSTWTSFGSRWVIDLLWTEEVLLIIDEQKNYCWSWISRRASTHNSWAEELLLIMDEHKSFCWSSMRRRSFWCHLRYLLIQELKTLVIGKGIFS